ncbi:FkbM family methyltransferase [Cohnella caldifontis]|uniref:FkbM family methyltransferase n=1 Tax=Cohnella caldifontis TaxID=3027471 RepID=UPI0023ED4B3D|nr:FkbM family methyltransferase [Cohnella sp. YIM B05605]
MSKSMLKTVFNRVQSRYFPTPQQKRVRPWFNDKGDETLRLNYDLHQNSVVFDLGGYKGQWTSDIYAKYNCKVFVFEPVLEYFEKIKQRFDKNQNINVFPFGLSNSTTQVTIGLSNDGSSVFKEGPNTSQIRLIEAKSFLEENKIDFIDLMKINIEGAEYDLLDHLIEIEYIKNIRNIQVQFHDFVPEAEKRMRKIQRILSKSHTVTYQYEFVWENWALKG